MISSPAAYNQAENPLLLSNPNNPYKVLKMADAIYAGPSYIGDL
jgi:hypothetical protein